MTLGVLSKPTEINAYALARAVKLFFCSLELIASKRFWFCPMFGGLFMEPLTDNAHRPPYWAGTHFGFCQLVSHAMTQQGKQTANVWTTDRWPVTSDGS